MREGHILQEFENKILWTKQGMEKFEISHLLVVLPDNYVELDI